jgi:hypothetical protein
VFQDNTPTFPEEQKKPRTVWMVDIIGEKKPGNSQNRHPLPAQEANLKMNQRQTVLSTSLAIQEE